MLIRWAAENERRQYGYPENEFDEHDVLVAVDRMTEKCIGIVGFSRESNTVEEPNVFDVAKKEKIIEKLKLCVDRQCNPKGQSFHYRYPQFIKEARREFCPVCNNEPAPDDQMDIAVNDTAWVCGEYPGQGRLFGKMYVMPRKHAFQFEDMQEDEMILFMREVQRVGRALRKVTGAIKINYEMHSNSGAHLHIHLFPRYLDDDFPGMAIDINQREPAPYESYEEYLWFVNQMRKELSQ